MLMHAPVLVSAQDIVDPDGLETELLALLSDEKIGDSMRGPAGPRAAVVTLLKRTLNLGKAEIEQRFMAANDGAAAVASTSFLMDSIIRALFRVTTEIVFPMPNPTSSERLAVLAVGGYGRGELAPYSDIDLLFLLPYKRTPVPEQVVEFMLYVMWDLGLKVGHATRSLDDTLRQAQADVTIRTALLESRHLCGDEGSSQLLRDRFREEVIEGSGVDFVDAKLLEREKRHLRMGDSRYVLEPNIKEGKGGLRDLHSLFWIAKYLFHVDTLDELVELDLLEKDEAHRFVRAQNFLWTVRCHLHYLARRAEERLTFDVQAEIGRMMGYTDHAGSRGVERFMKHYFLIAKDVGDLTRIFIAALESEQKRKMVARRRSARGSGRSTAAQFVVDGGRLTVADNGVFAADPVNILRLFHMAQVQKLDIHPNALRLVTQSLKLIDPKLRQDPVANQLFLEMLTSRNDPETTLRRLNEARVFGRFVPDFGRVVAQMQYDMYHVYTVDEHTIYAIGVLARIESEELHNELSFAASLIGSVVSRRALYVAVLLHDIAKGRPTDHSETGAKIALTLGPRFGLTEEETETVSWLVRYHLLMSRTAFKRDLDDVQTIYDFVEKVQSPERLKLLLVLTTVDIYAVGPGVWNGWKAALLRRLYERALELMSGGTISDGRDSRIAKAQEAARAELPDFSDADFASLVGRTYPYYWLSTDPAVVARHARMMREADRDGAPLTVSTRVDLMRCVTEVTIYTGDHPGLFSGIAGALALAGASIVDARIVTLANGMALDSFWIQDAAGGAFARPDRLAKLSVLFEHVLSGTIKPQFELKRPAPFPSRSRVFTVPPRVLIDNKASATHTVIEINGRDRPGLLFYLTRAITTQGLQISNAKIATYGEKVVDVFYVKDLFGLKVESERHLAKIREALIAVFEDGGATKPAGGEAAPVVREHAPAGPTKLRA
jgi:[protein-PII] uridylyltransferase